MLELCNNDTIFISNDLDLNKLSQEELKLCCECNLLIKTNYPKLILFLFFNDNFQKWLENNNINKNNKDFIINNLINAVKIRDSNLINEMNGLNGMNELNETTETNKKKNKIINTIINLNQDKELWNLIVQEFICNNEELFKKKEKYNNNNNNIIIRRKKSLKKINSNKLLLITI